MKVLVSGSSGFIGGYVVEELLERGHDVVGIDNHSKYGRISKSYDDHPRYRLVEGDAQDVPLMTELLSDFDHFIAGAALIGGISYFHTYAYDLLAQIERIMAASCDAAIAARRAGLDDNALRRPPRQPPGAGEPPVRKGSQAHYPSGVAGRPRRGAAAAARPARLGPARPDG